jgi:hypothetical protein
MNDCPICGEGKVTEHCKEVDGTLSKWSTCDHCLSEFANAEQVRFNKEEAIKQRSSTGQHRA